MSRIRGLWARHFLLAELLASAVLTALFGVWMWRFEGEARVDAFIAGNRGSIYGTLASILGALLGFVVTALAILISVADSERLAVLRASRHYGTLWRVFIANIRALAFGTVVVLAALLIDRDGKPEPILQILVAGAVALTVLRVARAAWILDLVVQLLTKERSGRREANQQPTEE